MVLGKLNKKTMATKVTSIEHLEQILNDGEGRDFYILLNGGLRSSKHISYDDTSTFWVLNLIDDTEQELTEAQLMDRDYTNIGYAIENGAFYLDE